MTNIKRLEEYEKELKVHPTDYFGAIDDWMDEGFSNAIFAHHRDSDILDESNWAGIVEEMEQFEDDVRTTNSNHWAVGWVETMHVRMRDWAGNFTPAFKHAIELKERLEDYPLLDEEDYSRREWEDLHEYCEQEVGDEHAHLLATYLFNKYSVSRSDDVRYEWIEEWKAANIKEDE